ncbi:type II toxin-antitoxin system VapC family toxin [candidate division KSB1 bacterium]|nr:type II toxin-antitoxin system VapC family toxin [candidate division KSB1 bacterium]
MKVLLDTHAFLWLMVDDPRLSATARATFQDVNNHFLLSMASVWEMAIKAGLQKLKLPAPARDYVATRTQRHNIHVLDISLEHCGRVESLPFHHKDPFDRLIIAQAIIENLPILTDDKDFDSYPITKIW